MTIDKDPAGSLIISPRGSGRSGPDSAARNSAPAKLRPNTADRARTTKKEGAESVASGSPPRLVSRGGMPTRIGRFTVLSLLGQGGMGSVYACYDEQLDRKVAVKVLRMELLLDNKTATKRLMREAQSMARLSHSNIVTVHEAGESEGMVYVAMEFVAGKSLEAWIREPHPWQEVLSVFVQAGRGLAAAHRVGIVHRDFKPQNAMINEGGLVKVLDFGLARVADDNMREAFVTLPETGEKSIPPMLLTLTRTGTILGTPAYMSPEQHLGEVATAHSDQFSFCASLYQGLYGYLPYAVDSMESLKRDVLQGVIAPPSPRSPVPERLFRALRRGMLPDPTQRFGSMGELLTALERDPMRRFWQGAALVGTLITSGGVSAAIVGTNQVEVCPDASAELAGIWDPAQKASIEASMQMKIPTQASDMMATLVGPQLDSYAAAWIGMRNEACLAHAEGRQSPQLFDQRTSCLEQRRASLSATVEALRDVDSTTLANAIKAVRALPRLEVCADVEALEAELPPPEDPKLRIRVQHHRETLARAEVLEMTSRTREARALTEGVLADAGVHAYEPLLAEAYLHKGNALIQERAGSALAPLDEALSVALRIGHARVAALASARRVWVLAELLGRENEAQGDLFWVSALNQKMRKDVPLYKEYLAMAYTVHRRSGDWTSAENMIQESLALTGKAGSQETIADIATLDSNFDLAALTHRYEDALASVDRSSALSEKLLKGSDSYAPLRELNRAYVLTELGRPRAGVESAERSRELAPDLVRTVSFLALAAARSHMGDFGSARHHFLEALEGVSDLQIILIWRKYLIYHISRDGDVAAMEKVVEKMTSVFGPDLPADGFTSAAVGRHRQAVDLFLQERATLEKSERLKERFELAFLALALGQSYRKLGEYDNAERELTDSLTAYQALVSSRNLELAEVMLALGELALEREQFARAAEWLQKAEAGFATTAEPDYFPLMRTRTALAQAQAASLRPEVAEAP